MNFKLQLLITVILLALTSLITHNLTKYYVRKVELTTTNYKVSGLPAMPVTHDTMSVYTFNNIYHIDFKNLMIFNEMNDQQVSFNSYTELFDYVEEITAQESNDSNLINMVLENTILNINNNDSTIVATTRMHDKDYINLFDLPEVAINRTYYSK